MTVSDWGVRCTRPDGIVEEVAWDDLQSVEVHTRDCGPFVEDVFFVLFGVNGGCAVPQSAHNNDELVAKILELPGFKYDEWLAAMSSTANNRFVCWQRQNSEARDSQESGA